MFTNDYVSYSTVYFFSNLASLTQHSMKKLIFSYENQSVKFGPDPQKFDKYYLVMTRITQLNSTNHLREGTLRDLAEKTL